MNPISQMVNFTREAWAELKKVHTPTRQETILITIRVVVGVIIISTFLGCTDLVIGKLIQGLLM